jgi:hypothetical protein
MFYLKARFPKPPDTDAFEKEMCAVAERSYQLHNFWQDVRYEKLDDEAMCKRMRDSDPDLYDRMQLERYAAKSSWGPSNAFAGLIPTWHDVCEVDTDGDTVVLRLSDSLWSSQDLEPYADLLRSYGATNVAWLTADDICPFDVLEV